MFTTALMHMKNSAAKTGSTALSDLVCDPATICKENQKDCREAEACRENALAIIDEETEMIATSEEVEKIKNAMNADSKDRALHSEQKNVFVAQHFDLIEGDVKDRTKAMYKTTMDKLSSLPPGVLVPIIMAFCVLIIFIVIPFAFAVVRLLDYKKPRSVGKVSFMLAMMMAFTMLRVAVPRFA